MNQEKICPICKTKFETEDERKIYCSNSCKQKNFYKNHKEEIKNYREKNKDRKKEYLEKNKEKIKRIGKEYRKNHKNERREYGKEYREKNKEKIKAWRDNHKDRTREYDKEYIKSSRGKITTARKVGKRQGYGNIIFMPPVFNGMCKQEGHHVLGILPSKHRDFRDCKRIGVFFIPSITHKFEKHFINGEHWRFIGDWLKKVYCMDIGNFLSGKDFMVY